MKIISLIDKDIYLTYSWNESNHGICGHTYEVIEYYMILKKYFRVGIFLAELNLEIIENIIRYKYNFTEEEINDLLSNCVFNIGPKPTIIKANTIIFTDGGYSRLLKFMIFAKNVLLFSCGDKDIKLNNKNNWYILQDSRVYDKALTNSFHYIKKILFNRLKYISPDHHNRTLIYATENCRGLTSETKEELFNRDENYLVIANDPTPYMNIKNVEVYTPPVKNIFEQFSKYIYTPVSRKWDCSPRFIAECKYYNKEVIYYNIDYLETDLGLKYRIFDIENDFESLYLNDDDIIINFLKELIK